MRQIGNKIIQLDVVDSTNNFTANLLKSGELGHGTVILADEQTAGKGQRGSTWLSEGGSNVIMSVFVEYDNLTVEKKETINHWVSLSILGLLKKYNISGQIKWPNDILVNSKKIAGILIENQIGQGRLKSSIIGIGLNVNQQNFEGLLATSLQLNTNEFHPVNEIVMQLLSELNNNRALLLDSDLNNLKQLYHQNLWRFGESVNFIECEIQYSGIISGTNEEGLLIVNVNGHEKAFDLKQVKFLID